MDNNRIEEGREKDLLAEDFLASLLYADIKDFLGTLSTMLGFISLIVVYFYVVTK
jgi:hypothetical protein